MQGKKRTKITDTATFIGLVCVTVICLLPWLLMLRISLISPARFFEMPVAWTAPITLEHFIKVLSGRFPRFLLNSLILSLSATFIVMTVGTLAAFALARFRFKAKENVLFFILSTRMGPPVVFAVPLYILMVNFSLVDTYLGMILLYTFYNLAFAIWMMYGFFQDMPVEAEEAAMLDGLDEFGVFLRVSLPIAAAGLIATAILVFSFTWNEFFYALIMSRNVARTFPAQIPSFFGAFAIDWGGMFASSIMGTIMPLAFGISVRKHLARGLSMGAVK